MVGSGDHPLFRTLVVCGASLVSLGCGGRTEDGDRKGAAGGPTRGGAAGAAGVAGAATNGGAGQSGTSGLLCPENCEYPGQYLCDEFPSGTNCRCAPGAPRSADECNAPWDYDCVSGVRPALCGAPIGGTRRTFGCHCSREGLRPEDCASPVQFQCTPFSPIAEDCRCDPSAPSKPEDCAPPSVFGCYKYDPDVGCVCHRLLPIR